MKRILIASEMLHCKMANVPKRLVTMIMNANTLCIRAQGELVSRQAIAAIVVSYNEIAKIREELGLEE